MTETFYDFLCGKAFYDVNKKEEVKPSRKDVKVTAYFLFSFTQLFGPFSCLPTTATVAVWC